MSHLYRFHQCFSLLYVHPYSPVSLKDVVMHMQQYLKPERYEFHIRRGRVLDDLLKETRKLAFHPLKRVQVSLPIDIWEPVWIHFISQTWFIGEVGSNTGGLTRELWRLLGLDVMRLCEGQPNMLVLRHDSDRVLVGVYIHAVYFWLAVNTTVSTTIL